MINQKSVAAVNASKFGDHFTKPLYNSYCFSNIPQTVKNLLADEHKPALPDDVLGDLPKSYNKVILFFVDAFGWRFFERYSDKYPFLKRIVDKGVVSKITSQFPSTTPAHVTAIHTGVPVGKSGIYEWFFYEPNIDSVIAPLLFSYAGDKARETLLRDGHDPKDVFPKVNIYKDLAKYGVKSFVYQQAEFTPSPFGDVVFEGAKVFPYHSFEEVFTQMTTDLLADNEKAYHFFYSDIIDHAGHVHGPSSPEFEAAVDAFFTAAETLFFQQLSGKLKDTIFLMTADHGQMEINPATTYYLNLEIPDFVKYVKTNKKGVPLIPAGAPRDMFLYIKEEYLDEVHTMLQKKYKDVAEVHKVQPFIDDEFFCAGKPSQVFLSRAANLVILPYKNQSFWWYERDKYLQLMYGHHGGMSKEEMETTFFALSDFDHTSPSIF